MTKPQLRSGQLVTTFGPGAMVDFPDASVIVAGLDHWKYDPAFIPLINEPRLAAKCARLLDVPGVTLRAPPPASDKDFGEQPDIVAWRFPNWYIVQESEANTRGFRRRKLVHFNALEKGRFRDPDTRTPMNVVPVRFVRACRRGHVGDIDWRKFVHDENVKCSRQLWIEERGTSGDLDEVWVTCECGAKKPLSAAAKIGSRALGACDGSRPWLGPDSKEECHEPSRLLIRSASNAYFPQLLSVISIPDTHEPVEAAVRILWEDFLFEVVDLEGLQRARRRPTVQSRLHGMSDAEVMAAILRVGGKQNANLRPVKEVEFEALSEAREEIGADQPDGHFFARALPASAWGEAPWMKSIERIVLAHRLREVVAQVSFTRFEGIGADAQGELSLDVEPASLSRNQTWLPAVENRGEGIFIQFKSVEINAWMQRPETIRRGQKLLAGFAQWKKDHPNSNREFLGMPYVMLHSFSHLLLTVIALECGYPASSIRERIYAAQDKCGLLIYTGASDAEGTLGGLIQAGRDIKRHIQRALELGTLCSNDPVCAFHAPDEHDGQPLLGSACHGCLLLSETSCEQRNDFLDRALVVPTVESLGAEFFVEPHEA